VGRRAVDARRARRPHARRVRRAAALRPDPRLRRTVRA
jgi:hypothetical protein